MAEINNLHVFMTKMSEKTYSGVTHTYIAHIEEYPLGLITH